VAATGGTSAFSEATDTAAITINSVNDAPTSAAGSTTINEDTPIAGSLPGATDVDGDLVSYALGATNASHGTVTVHANGTFDYTPYTNINASHSNSSTVSYGQGGTNEYSYAITITEVNDAPTAVADTATVAEDSTGNVINILGND